MRDYTVTALCQDIRVALDMNMNSTPLTSLGDVDTLSLDQIIESKIETAARMVEASAPYYLLGLGQSIDNEMYTVNWTEREGNGPGYMHLPSDFLRLVTFQMSDWSRAVTEAITEDDPRYAMQYSRYPGIKGCPQKPVVAITKHPEGLMLEFYSCTAGTGVTVKRATYIPIPKITSGSIAISEKLKPAVVYQAAALVAMTIGNDAAAEKMQNICNGLKQ